MFLKQNILLGTKPFPSLTMGLNFLCNPLPTLAADKMEILLECEFHPRKTKTVSFSYHRHGTVISTPKTVVNASITMQKMLD